MTGCWPPCCAFLNEEGFRVVGAHEVLVEALGPRGLLSLAAPDAQAMADIRRGIVVARALGAVDVGQCCVVQQGMVLAVEAAEGTDAMLARGGPSGAARLRRRAGQAGQARPGPPRRPADHRPRHDRGRRPAGLRGVAFEAGGTILAERAATIAAADAAGLFLLGLDPDSPDTDTERQPHPGGTA